MVTIVEFLRARLDEDEQIARAVADHRGRRGELSWQTVESQSEPGLIGNALGGLVTFHGANQWQAAHIVRHDPARVLAEVEAKRRILTEHAPVQQGVIWTGPHGAPGTERVPDWRCGRCSDYFPEAQYDEDTHISHSWPCLTARLLALPYADHPDYDKAWQPTS